MANIQIKSKKLTPFGGIFSIMEQFDFIYFCGGSCIEDVTTHLI